MTAGCPGSAAVTEAPLWHARAYAMVRDGYSLKQIAHACGVSKTTLGRLLYPDYRRAQAKARRDRRKARMASDPAFRAAEQARIARSLARRRAREQEQPPCN